MALGLNAFENRMPRCANLSRFGVLTSGLPEQPIMLAGWLSTKTTRTFGCIGKLSLRVTVVGL